MSARFTRMLRATSYTPGVSRRCLPRESWALISSTESAGSATKKSSSDSVRPGVSAAAQVVPDEPCCARGTRTFQAPLSSTNR